MTAIGLKKKDERQITQLLRKFPDVAEAVVFGSRAKRTFKTGSDIDIALKGKKLNSRTVSKIHDLLEEETLLPYFFDVLNYHEISSRELIDHIDRVGVVLYRK